MEALVWLDFVHIESAMVIGCSGVVSATFGYFVIGVDLSSVCTIAGDQSYIVRNYFALREGLFGSRINF